MNGSIIYYCPHLLSKIFYEFYGLTTPSCIAFKKAIDEEEIIADTTFNFVIGINEKKIKENFKNIDDFLFNFILTNFDLEEITLK